MIELIAIIVIHRLLGFNPLDLRLLLQEAVVFRSVLAVPSVVRGIGVLVLLRVPVVLVLAVLLLILLAVDVVHMKEPVRRHVRRVGLVAQIVAVDHVVAIIVVHIVVVPVPLGLGLGALGLGLLLQEAVVFRSVLAVPRVVRGIGVLVLLRVPVVLVLAVLLL